MFFFEYVGTMINILAKIIISVYHGTIDVGLGHVAKNMGL